MKRFLLFFLCFLILIGAVSCNKEERATTTADEILSQTENQTENPALSAEETKETAENAETAENSAITETKEAEYAKVINPLTPERIAAIPIAKQGMSTEELRQICIDFISLQVSFTWVPTQTLTYTVDRHGVNVTINEGKLYGGIPYVNVASGNIYRILRYYDTETGHLDISALSKDKERFGTACSGSACWGWTRVVNSASLSWTANMTKKNGCLPVGPYTYDFDTFRFGEDGFDDCSDIAAKNGRNTMFESYALMHKADGLVNNGHVTMCSSEPVVVRNEDGTINGHKSYLTWCEQGLFTYASSHDRVQEDGTPYKIQGNVNLKKTFHELYESNYLPFTFAEFLGQDPVEEAELILKDSAGTVYDPATVSLADLRKTALISNYNMSDIHTVVKDAEGNAVLDFAYPSANHSIRQWKLYAAVPFSVLDQAKAKGGVKLELSVQLSNGEKPIFYECTL